VTPDAHRSSRWSDGWFVVPYEVVWRDLDALGHVNNAVFFTYFEIARTKLWFDLLGGSSVSDISFIVVRAECDFRREMQLGERFEIRTRIGSMGTTSIEFLSEIRKGDGEDVAASGRTVGVLFSWEKRSRLPIPEELRTAVAEKQQRRDLR
jgi:acyl-CoA thioester hydrolase